MEGKRRQERIMKSVKECPECGEKQIQLVTYICQIKYKCRVCKHEWIIKEEKINE